MIDFYSPFKWSQSTASIFVGKYKPELGLEGIR